jgi:TRAP transporter TAXI family solute receptor
MAKRVQKLFTSTTATLAAVMVIGLVMSPSAFSQTRMTYGSSGIGGVSFVVGAGLTNLWNQEMKDKVLWSCETSGGSTQNIAWISSGMIQAGNVSSDRVWAAKEGTGFFKKSGPLDMSKVRSMMVMYGNWFQPVVRADFPGEYVEDLFGKRVAVGQPGHSSQAYWDMYGEVWGVKPKEKIQYEYVADYDAVDALRSGRADGISFGTGMGAGTITEAFSTMKLKMLKFKPEFVQKVTAKYPYHAEGVIPKGTYEGLKEDMVVMGGVMCLIVSTQLSEDIVYEMTQIMWKHIKDGSLATVAKNFNETTLSPAIQIVTGVPIHDGARKFYEENGITLKPVPK